VGGRAMANSNIEIHTDIWQTIDDLDFRLRPLQSTLSWVVQRPMKLTQD